MFRWSQSLEFARPPRRDILRAGFLGLGGLSLGDLLRHSASASPSADHGSATGVSGRKKSVILYFLHGGPSHLETYDLKPHATAEIRGPFQPVATNVPGIDVCEHLPLQAQRADRFTLIRSVTHDEADHFAGHRRFLSGYGQLKPGTSYESHYPQLGAVANRVLSGSRVGMPAAVAVGGVVVNGPDYAPAVSEGFWSGAHRVPIVNGGLRDSHLAVEAGRLNNRLALRQGLDGFRRELDRTGTMDVMDEFNRRAVEILTTGAAAKAFDLNREDPRIRDKYGEGFGQTVLTARRLVEAGVRFVTINDPGYVDGTNIHNWDDHAVNWDLLTAMRGRLPRTDRLLATLMDDLHDRGLSDDVLLVVTGEFGRTPRLEFQNGKIGRDHWPSAMSILVSGGGLPMGQVIGATDNIGARPSRRPLDPHDFLATIYKFLGIDPNLHFNDPFGRPIPICRGTPISELV